MEITQTRSMKMIKGRSMHNIVKGRVVELIREDQRKDQRKFKKRSSVEMIK